MMVVVRPWKLLCATMILDWSGGHALDVGAPLAGHLDAALDGLGAAVHRQHHVLAAQLGERRAERAEPVGVERAADQRDGVELGVRGGGDLRVAVAEVHRRVGGQAVQVAAALDVGDPDALGGRGDDGQRRVVVRRVVIVERDRGLGDDRPVVGHHGVQDGHEYTSSVQHLTDPPPLSSSDRSTPIGFEAGVGELLGEAGGGGGQDDVPAVGDGVEAEHVGVGGGDLDGVGEQLAAAARGRRR